MPAYRFTQYFENCVNAPISRKSGASKSSKMRLSRLRKSNADTDSGRQCPNWANEHARRDKKTVGEVISELALSALSLDGFRPFPKRGGIVSNGLIDKLREEDPY
jgi:hypothetical protein